MKKKYLLDTCICIHFLQNRPEVVKKIQQIGWDKCCIAEATIGELLCGVRDDGRKARNVNIIESFISDIEVVPTGLAIRKYAKQMAKQEDMTEALRQPINWSGSDA